MKLSQLNPEFLKSDTNSRYTFVDSKDKADGFMFQCPKCFKEKGGEKGVHYVVCWEPSVPQTISPKPGRWTMHGSGFNDMTLTAIPTDSVLLQGGCNAHFYIKEGNIIDA